MRRVAGCVVVGVLALLLSGCGLPGSGVEDGEIEGYLLRREAMREGPSAGVMFIQFVPEGDGRIRGRMHTAFPVPEGDMPSVNFATSNLTGTVNDSDVMIEEEQFAPGAVGDAIYIDYYGTLEGDSMRLTTNVQGILTSWEGEAATLEDFGAAAEELANEAP